MSTKPHWRDESARQSWFSEPWLRQNRLDRTNALEYFKLSHWYDPMSNNNILEQNNQTIDNLVHLTGVEYMSDPPASSLPQVDTIYIIRKQWRQSPTVVRLLALYVVIGSTNESHGIYEGQVFQMPDLSSVLSSKLSNVSYHMKRMLTSIKDLTLLHDTSEASQKSDLNTLTIEKESQESIEAPALDSIGLDAITAQLFSETFAMFKTDLLHEQ